MREIKYESELPSVIGLGSYIIELKCEYFIFFECNTDQSINISVLRGMFHDDA